MLTLLINETKPLAGLFASTTGGIGSVPDISVADEGQAVSVQTFTRTAGVITDSFVAGDVLHIGIGDGVNAPVCYIELSSASPATGTMAINTVGMVALFAATSANQLSLQVGVVRTRGAYTNTIFSAPIVIHRSVIDPDTAVPTPSILGAGVYAALQVAINTALGFVRLDSSARLPAVDGSQLTNVPNELPSQTGNIGKYLTTNGTATSWGTVSTGLTVGTTAIASGTSGRILYDNAGVLGELPVGTGVATALAVSVGSAGAFLTSAVTSITGTANEITVTGTTTPTLSLPSALTFTGKTVTNGTFNSGAFNGTVGATTPSTIAGTTGTFDSTVTVGANSQDGTLNVKASGGTTTASIDGSDGSASFASGYFTVDSVGGINSVTSISAGNGVTVLDSGGTASFNGGTITLGTNTGTAAWIHSNGSASFASGYCAINSFGNIDTDGQISFGADSGFLYSDGSAAFRGTVAFQDGNGTPTASINGSGGSASFLNGAVVITDSPSNQIDAYGIYLYIGTVYVDNALNISYDGGVTQLVTIGANNGTEAWIHSDGSASFASGSLTIDQYGNISASNAALYIDTVYADNGLWINDGVTTLASLDSDGTAQFKTGAITLGKNTGTAAYIDENGNASFSNGQTVVEYGDVSSYQFTAEYNVTIGSNSLAGTLNVKDSSDTTTASIDGADGSASFGYQGGNIGLMIDQYGNITTNNSAEATLYNLHADNLLTVGKSGNAGTLNVKDSSDTTTASIDGSSGTLTLAGALIGGTQALVTSGGAGAVNLTTLTTEVETTGTLDALTLANGTVGQIKIITHTVGAFTSVLTPTTAVGFTSITFLASLGQTCTLEYTNAGWVILAVGGLTLPVVA